MRGMEHRCRHSPGEQHLVDTEAGRRSPCHSTRTLAEKTTDMGRSHTVYIPFDPAGSTQRRCPNQVADVALALPTIMATVGVRELRQNVSAILRENSAAWVDVKHLDGLLEIVAA